MSNPTFPPDEYLSAEEVDTLHGALTESLEALVKQSKEALHDLTDVRSADADALDLAVSESNRDFSLRLADRERRLMTKIRLALSRMQEGEYGACEACGEPITYKRLLARPVATLCIDCKTEAEQLERRKQVF